jgi:hypothetical protein
MSQDQAFPRPYRTNSPVLLLSAFSITCSYFSIPRLLSFPDFNSTVFIFRGCQLSRSFNLHFFELSGPTLSRPSASSVAGFQMPYSSVSSKFSFFFFFASSDVLSFQYTFSIVAVFSCLSSSISLNASVPSFWPPNLSTPSSPLAVHLLLMLPVLSYASGNLSSPIPVALKVPILWYQLSVFPSEAPDLQRPPTVDPSGLPRPVLTTLSCSSLSQPLASPALGYPGFSAPSFQRFQTTFS